MSQLSQDMRYTFRTLRGAPGFAVVAMLTLAVGIGANATIFSFVNGILLNPLPYPTADRIVRVLEKPPGPPRRGMGSRRSTISIGKNKTTSSNTWLRRPGAAPFSPVPEILFNCAAHELAFTTSIFSA